MNPPRSRRSPETGAVGPTEAAWLHHYQELGVTLRFRLWEEQEIEGRLDWYGGFAYGLIRADGGEVAIMRHAVHYYEPTQPVEPPPMEERGVNWNLEHLILVQHRRRRTVFRFHLVEGHLLEGRLKWYDLYAVKLIPLDRSPDLTVHKHAVIYYESGGPETGLEEF